MKQQKNLFQEFNNPGERQEGINAITWVCNQDQPNCNLKYWISYHISFVFHNLSGHDAHFFVKQLRKIFNKSDIGVTAENNEKYSGFNVKIIVKIYGLINEDGREKVRKNIQQRFIDIYRFMASTLDKLASNL